MMNCDIIQTMEKIEERFLELVRFDEVVEKDVGLPLIGVDEAPDIICIVDKYKMKTDLMLKVGKQMKATC